MFSKWNEQVLSSMQNLVSLPPHLIELDTALRALKMRRFEDYSWSGILRVIKKRAYGKSYSEISGIVDKYLEKGRIPEDVKKKC